ncbi:MAG TPA: hypothetical protein VIZ59_03790, partial [Rubrobacteraceae bacterium]
MSGGEDVLLDHGPWREDARDLARELLGTGRVRPLLCYGYLVPLPEQHREVLLESVARHPGERDPALA